MHISFGSSTKTNKDWNTQLDIQETIQKRKLLNLQHAMAIKRSA